MFVEFRSAGISTFILADVCHYDDDDIRAMCLNATLAPINAEDLHQQVPVVLEMDPTTVIRPAAQEEITQEGVDHKNIMMLLNPDKLQEMPRWKWNQIFKLLKPVPS